MFLQRLLKQITANGGTQPAKVEAALPRSLHIGWFESDDCFAQVRPIKIRTSYKTLGLQVYLSIISE